MQILVESHQTKTLLLDMPRVGCQKGKAVSKKNTPIYTGASCQEMVWDGGLRMT